MPTKEQNERQMINTDTTNGTSSNKLSLKGVLTEILEKVIEPVNKSSNMLSWARSEEENARLATLEQKKIDDRNSLLKYAEEALEDIVKKNQHLLKIPKDTSFGAEVHPLSIVIADEILAEKNPNTAKGRVAQAIRSKAPDRDDKDIKNGVGVFKGLIERIDNALTPEAMDKIKLALAVERDGKNLVQDGVNEQRSKVDDDGIRQNLFAKKQPSAGSKQTIG